MNVSVVHGDCLDVMRGMDEASVDAIVTDPPYGLEFMGKDWDTFKQGDAWSSGAGMSKPGIGDRQIEWPAFGQSDSPNATCAKCGGRMRGARKCDCAEPEWLVKGKPLSERPNNAAVQMRAFGAWCEVWSTECLRVLKPGGYMLAFGGTRTWHRLAVAVEDAGFEIRDSIAWLHGQGFPKGQAGLKPAHEPIVVARKQPSAPRTGLLQIDACRVDGGARPLIISKSEKSTGILGDGLNGSSYGGSTTVGRWPANVVLDETQAHALDQQTGMLTSGDLRPYTAKAGDRVYAHGLDRKERVKEYDRTGDSGGASRFYYVAKAGKKERPVVNGVAHATVKPLTLMRWLVRLVTPPGGTVLDPFAGSGTTVEAAILEGFTVIGIERDAEYLPLIDVRIARNDPTLDLGDGGAA